MGIALSLAGSGAGCGAIAGVDFDEVHPRGSGGGDAVTSSSSGSGGAGGASCDPAMAVYNAEGCLCETAGVVKSCHLGVPGPNSACDTEGTQICEKQSDLLAWGACNGASAPSPETCFDSIDNDCNGTIDDACACHEGIDMCAGLAAGDHLFMPKEAKMGSTIEVFVLSTMPLPSPALEVNMGHCPGISGTADCILSKTCVDAGWYSFRRPVDIQSPAFSPGTATLTFYINNPNVPCTDPADRKVSGMMQINP